ncbi:MAG TPA: FG-GAP repeat protein [Friedmanniella sp.]
MTRRRVFHPAALAALALGLAGPLALAGVPASAARSAAKPYDFDGDSRPELVVGAPGLVVGGHAAAGGLTVVQPTRRTRPARADARLITQSTSGVAGASEYGDDFGAALASADFDGDGYADLAVGLPGEDLSGVKDAGAVTILYGSKQGLTGARSVQLAEPTGKAARARFGTALAAGDLDGDGYADLAVGAPDQDVELSAGGPTAHGTVTVLHGGRKGISTTGSTRLRGVVGTPEPDREFGTGLAVTDVDADGRADLAVLSGGYDSSDDDGDPGSLSFCAGGAPGGPTGCRRLVRDDALRGGSAFVVGNVSGDARPELVVGGGSDPELDPGHLEVATLSGTGAGTTAGVVELYDHDLGVHSGGAFGDALAIGDQGGDSHDDLVVGAWDTDESDDPPGGQVFVVRGGQHGLARTGNVTYNQDTPGVPGSSESGDDFGYAVTLADRDGDGRPDLVVGNPDEDGTGRVTTLRGTGSGFTTAGAGAFGLADLGVKKGADADFGQVLGP